MKKLVIKSKHLKVHPKGSTKVLTVTDDATIEVYCDDYEVVDDSVSL